jgi:hypothetical protein
VPRIAAIIAAIVLTVHGLVHLIGTAFYVYQIHMKGFTDNTKLLGGRWDVGDAGIRVFGWLWALPAVGFVAVALVLLVRWPWWKPLLISVTFFSLALTVLDWSSAFLGGVIDIAILILLLVGSRAVGSFPR